MAKMLDRDPGNAAGTRLGGPDKGREELDVEGRIVAQLIVRDRRVVLAKEALRKSGRTKERAKTFRSGTQLLRNGHIDVLGEKGREFDRLRPRVQPEEPLCPAPYEPQPR